MAFEGPGFVAAGDGDLEAHVMLEIEFDARGQTRFADDRFSEALQFLFDAPYILLVRWRRRSAAWRLASARPRRFGADRLTPG